jgi:ribosomal protein S4E
MNARLIILLLIFSFFSYSQNIKAQCNFTISPSSASTGCYISEEDVVWKDLVNVTTTGNTLTKTTANGWNGGAASTANVYNFGYVYCVANQANTDRFIGLSASNPDATNNSIQFAIDLTNAGGLNIYENGANRGAIGTYAVGDTLKVALEFNRIKYYKNNTLLYISNLVPASTLIADVSLNQIGSKLSNVVIGNLSNGNFTANSTNAGSSPSYQWTLNGVNTVTTNSYTNTTFNANDLISCTLTYGSGGCAVGSVVSNNIKIKLIAPSYFEYFYLSSGSSISGCSIEKEQVIWDHSATTNLKENSNSLTKIQSGGNWDGGASSLNKVYNNGYIYSIAAETNTTRMFGLSNTNIDNNYTTIQYAFYLQNGGTLGIYESNANRGNYGTYSTGDTLKILVDQGIVKYFKNSTELYESTVVPTLPMLADVSINTLAGTINNVNIVNYTNGNISTISTNAGAIPTYQWYLNGSATGTNSSNYTYTPSNNDRVYCTMVPNLVGCSTFINSTKRDTFLTPLNNLPINFYIKPDLVSNACLMVKQNVNFTNYIFVTPSGNSITKTYNSNAWNAGASSLNTLNDNSYAYTVIAETNTLRAFGLSSSDLNLNFTSIQFAFYINNNGTFGIYESGTNVYNPPAPLSTYVTGDTLKVAIEQTKVKYYKNSQLLYISNTAPVLPLLVDMSLNTVNSTLKNITVVNATQSTFTGMSANSGMHPHYYWMLNGITVASDTSIYANNSLSNSDNLTCTLTPDLSGCTSVNISSNPLTVLSEPVAKNSNFYIIPDTTSKSCLLTKQKATITNIVNVAVSGNNITKFFNSNAWGNGGAASFNKVYNNGYAYTVAAETNTNRMFGLSFTDADANYTSIQYAIYLEANGTFTIYESGANPYNPPASISSYSTGDTFKVAVENGKVKYYKNSIAIYQSATAPTLPLLVDMSINSYNGTLMNITTVNSTLGGFSVNPINAGATPHFQWVLDNTNVGSDNAIYYNANINSGDSLICKLRPGLNGCLTTEAPSNTIKFSTANIKSNFNYYVTVDTASLSCLQAKQNVSFTNVINITTKGNNLTKYLNTGAWDAGAASFQKVYNNGSAYTVISETNTLRAFGLSTTDANVNFNTIQFGFYINSNGTFYILESGVNVYNPVSNTYATGDTMKVSVEQMVVKYYKNSQLIYQSLVSPVLPLLVDMTINTYNGTLKNVTVINSTLCKYNANVTSAGVKPNFQWLLDNVNVGTDTSYYYNSAIKNGDSIICKLQPTLGGCSSVSVPSNTMNISNTNFANNLNYYLSVDTSSYSCLQAKQKVKFTNLTKTNFSGNNLTKYINTNAWDAGAASFQKVYNNGSAYTVIAETNTYRAFGLSNTDANVNFTSIQFGFYLNNNGTYYILENGTNINNPNPNTYLVGDTLKVVVDQMKIKYYKNSQLVFQSVNTPVLPMLVDMSIWSYNGTLKNVTVINASLCSYRANVAVTPAHYQWVYNGNNVGSDASNYSNSNIVSGDSIYCKLTPAMAGCSLSQANSNAINISNAPLGYLSKMYLSIDTTSIPCLQTKQKVSFTNVVRLNTSGNSIIKYVSTGAWDAGASSLNKLNNNGYAYTVIAETNTVRSFGVSTTDADLNYTSIQFGFYLNNNGTCNITESGNNVYGGLTYSVGDTLKVAVENGKIRYYNNSTLLYQSLSLPVLPLIVDLSLNTINSTLKNITIVNGTQCKAFANVNNIGLSPLYQWKYNNSNTGTDTSYYYNSNMVAGDSVYCLITPTLAGCSASQLNTTALNYSNATINNNTKFYITVDTTSNSCLVATQNASFTDITNVIATGNNLYKYYNIGGWNSGVASSNKVYNNGYAYTIAAETNTSRMFGLSSVNADADYVTIQYALYLANNGTLQIYESGNYRGTFGNYNTGDTLKIAIELGKVHYYDNSNLLYESANNPSLPLLIDVSMNTVNCTLKNITIANGTKCSFKAVAINAGTAPIYNWKVNGSSVGSGLTYSNSGLNPGDIVACYLTPNLSGCNNANIAANAITLSIAPVSRYINFFIKTDTVSNSCLWARQKVNFTNIAYCTVNGNSITKFENTGAWNAGASSLNKVNNNSYAYTVVGETNTQRYFGLSTIDADATQNSIQYAFYLLNNGTLQIIESGSGKGAFGTYTSGDTLKISVESNIVKYYKNSQQLYESSKIPTLPMVVDVSLLDQNSTLNNIIVVNATQCHFYASAINVGASPSYQWKLNSSNVGIGLNYYNAGLKATDTIKCYLTPGLPGCSSIQANANQVVLKNASVANFNQINISPNTASTTCLVAKQKAIFTNLSNVIVTGNNLTKYLSNGNWDGGAASVNQIYDNSSVYTIANETNTNRMFGLSNSNPDANYTSIQYAIYLVNNGTLQIYESGVYKNSVGNYTTGDTLRISIEQGIVKYYKNSQYLYQSTILPTLPLMVDVSLTTINSTLNNITILNNTLCSFTANFINAGASPTFQWVLDNSNVGTNSSSYTNSGINSGDSIKCLITPNLPGCTLTQAPSNIVNLSSNQVSNLTKFYISVDTVTSYCLLAQQGTSFTDLTNLTATGNSLYKYYYSNNWDGGAASLNKVTNNSYVYTVIGETNTSRMFGLSHTNTDANFTTIQYAFYLVNNGTLQIYENGSGRGGFGNYNTGDTLKIAIVQGIVKYYQNSNLLYESTIAPVLPLMVDVSIATNGGTLQNINIVKGTQCKFYANATNAGITPHYQWKVNSALVGTDNPVYFNSNLKANDTVICYLTPNYNGCSATKAASNKIILANAPVSNLTNLYVSANNATTSCLIANQNAVFTDLHYVVVANNNIIKYYNSNNWDGNAFSFNKVYNNTSAYTIVGETNTYRDFGLSSTDVDYNYTSIPYSFYLASNDLFYVFENGNNMGNFGTYNTGDTLRISVESGVVKYYRNSQMLYQSTNAPTLPLYVDVSLYSPSSTLNNITIVNNTQCSFTANTLNAGTHPHFQWKLNNGNVGSDTSNYYNSNLISGNTIQCYLTPNLSGCSLTSSPSNLTTLTAAPVINNTKFYISVDTVTNSCLLANQNVNFTDVVYLTTSGNNLTKYYNSNNWDGGAASLNKVNNNSYAFTIVAETNTERMFGLSNADVDATNNTIQYGIYLVNNGTLQIYENGNYRASVGSYNTGDTLKVSVEQNKVRYYKGSSLLYESSTTPILPLIVDVSLKTQNSTLNNITVVNGTQCHFYANASNAGTNPQFQWKLNSVNVGTGKSYYNANLKANDLIVCVLTPDLPGCGSNQTTSNPIILSNANVSKVMSFYLSTDNVTNSCLYAKQNMAFTNLNYVAASGNNLTKYYNSGAWDGGAASLNKLNDNSYIYTVVAETNTSRMFGVSSTDIDAYYTSIQYAFYLVNNGTLQIYEDGNGLGGFGNYATGDTLKISIEQGNVVYYKNSTVLYRSLSIPVLPLIMDVSMQTLNSTLNSIAIVNRTQCTFTANASNFGTSPIFQWVNDGAIVGSNSTTYTDNNIISGDSVYCLLTPGLPGCSLTKSPSNTIKMISAPISNSTNFYISTQNASGSCLNAIQKPSFSDLVYVSVSGNNLTKTYNNNNWNAGASSYNRLYDNSMAYTVANETNTNRMFGLSAANMDADYINIQYAIYLVNNGTIQIYENGTNRGGFGNYTTGDTLKIAIIQGVVNYFKNSTLLYKSNSYPTLPLVLDVSINTFGGTLNNITFQNGTQGKFNANALNAGASPHYQWKYHGSNVGSDISYYYNNSIANNDSVYCMFNPGFGGCSASYFASNTINIKNSTSGNITKFSVSTDNYNNSCFRANLNVNITDTVKVTVSGNNLTKYFNSSNWDAGAASLNQINNNSYAYTVVSETNTERFFGLSNINSDATNTSIQYAIYLLNTGNLQIYESGASRGNFGTYASGDTLKVSSENGKIKYYKNSTLLYTSTVVPTLPLIVDASLKTINSTLQKITIVNGTQGIFYASALNAGAVPVYQWNLNGSNVGTDTSVYIPNAIHNNDVITCTLTPDLAGCSYPAIISGQVKITNTPDGAAATLLAAADTSGTPCLIAYQKAVLNDSIYVTVTGNNISKFHNNGNWDAGIASVNKVYNNSYAFTIAGETNTNRMFGLSHTNTNSNYQTINYAFYLQNGGALSIYENGNNVQNVGTYTTGDTLKVSVENGIIRYYKGSTFLYQSTNLPLLPLIIDASISTQYGTLKNMTIVNGTNCKFTATQSNGGTTPVYQWYVDGHAISGANSSAYTNNSLVAGDSVYCTITPSADACKATVAVSNAINLYNPVGNNAIKCYISYDTTGNSCFLAKQNATLTNGVNVTISGNNISKFYNSNNWDAGAASYEKVNNNGYAFTIIGETNTERYFGLSNTDINVSNTSIQYAFYIINNGTIQIYERASYQASVGSYTTGDTLKISVEQGVVKYYKNSSLLYQSATVPTLPLMVDCSLRTRYSTLNSITIANNTAFRFYANAINAGTNPNYQWILNGSNVSTNSYYSNSSMGANDILKCIIYPNIAGCSASNITSNPITISNSSIIHSLNYYIQVDTTSSSCLLAKQKVKFTDLVNLSASSNNLTKYYPSNNWDAGAASFNNVYNNGYVYTIAAETNTNRMFGLSNSNTNANFTSIQYAIYLVNNGTIQIYESGNGRGTVGNYATGDTLKVAIEQGVVNYYKNSQLLYQSAVTPTYPMLVDVSMNSQNSTLNNITVVNGTQCNFTANAINVGASPTYQWVWNGTNVGTGSTYSNSGLIAGDSVYCKLTPGIQGCSSVHLNSNSVKLINAPSVNIAKFYVSVDTSLAACLIAKQMVNFTNATYVSINKNNITKTYNNGGWNAGASSLNKVYNNSKAYTIVAETNTSRFFGLSTSDVNINYNSIQYAFYLLNNGTLQIYENGAAKGAFGNYSTGDTLKIAVVQGSIKYYQNSVLLYESSVLPTLPLIIDVTLGTYNSTLNQITIENGTQCNFYANAINAGAHPQYLWYLDGSTTGNTASSYSNNGLVAGDSVYCKLTPSNAGCASSSVTSNSVGLKKASVNNVMKFYVSIDTASSSCVLANQKVNFTDLTYVSANGNNLTKYYNSSNWNGGAASLNKVNNNSYAYTIASETNTYRMFGLSSTNTDANYTTIQYAIYLVNDGSIQIYESGIGRGTYGTYASGDTLKVSVENGIVKYYKNSTILYQSNNVPVLPLIVDVSMYSPNSTLKNITIVNGTQCKFTANAINAGTRPHYQWYYNGNAVGTDTSYYYNSNIVAGDSVYCNMTPGLVGCSSTSLTSNAIKLSNAPVRNNTQFYVSVDTVSTACLLAKQKVNFTDLVNVTVSANNLTKYYNSNNWDAGAASLNKVNNNSYAYTIVDETNTERFFGLSSNNSVANNSTVQYAFYLLNTGALQIYESGAYRGIFGNYSTNDTLKVSVEQGIVRYYQNSTLLYQSSITPTLPLIVDVSLRTVNSTLKNITVVNGTQCHFYANAINAGASPQYQWDIDGVNVGSGSTYTNSGLKANDYITCTLTPGFAGCNSTQITSNQILLSNAPVTNTTKFYVSVDNSLNACLVAKQKVNFTNLSNVSASGNNLLKYYNSNNWDGGAASLNKVNNNTYAYTIVAEANTQRMFGLSSTDLNSNYISIQFAFYLVNTGALNIYESGVNIGNYGNYSTGDTLKISVEQNVVKYYRNSLLLYQSGTTPILPLIVDVSLATQNSTLKNITIVNNSQCNFTANTSGAGNNPHYQWVWNNTNVGSDASTYYNAGLVAGDSVLCKLTPDLTGCSVTKAASNPINIANAQVTNNSQFYITVDNVPSACLLAKQNVAFTNIVSVDVSGNNLRKFTNTNLWDAGAASFQKVNNNSYAYTIIAETNTERFFGLSNTNTDASNTTIQYAFYLMNNGNIQIYENGTSKLAVGTYSTGDTLKVSIEQNIVKYYKNSTILYQSTTTPVLPLLVDVSLRTYNSTLNNITIVNGTQGTFTAYASNAGIHPHYQWKYNGANVGTDTSIYTNTTVVAGDIIKCALTPDLPGCTITSSNSNPITIVNASPANLGAFYITVGPIPTNVITAYQTVTFKDVQYLTVTNNNLKKYMAGGAWNGGAATYQTVNNNSYVYTVVAETNLARAIGLSTTNSGTDLNSIQYAVYLTNAGQMQIYESGVFRLAVGAYATNDTIKIKVVSNVVKYYKNSTLLYTSGIAPTLPMLVDVSLFDLNSTLKNITIVDGSDGTFLAYATNGGSSPTYQWKLNGVNVGTNSNSYINNTVITGDIVTCSMLPNILGCNVSALPSNTITLNVNPLPSAAGTIVGSANICQGQSGVVYTVPVISYATGYVWSLPAGASITSGANTNSITVSFSAVASSGNITVNGTNASGNGTISPNYAVTANSRPAAPITSAQSFCGSGVVSSLTGTPPIGCTINWYLASSGGSSLPGANSLVAGNYYAESLNSTTGCTSATRTTTGITINPLPSSSMLTSSLSSICIGSSTTLQVTITGGSSPYTVIISNAGTTNNYISGSNIVISPVVTTSYSITSVQDNKGCYSVGLSGNPTVTLLPKPNTGVMFRLPNN